MFNFLRVGSRRLEERIFINVLFISFIAVLLFTVNAIVVLKDLPIIITDAVAAIAIGILFYLTRFKRLYKQMISPYSMVILFTINAVWFISGGYDSPNGYILIAILMHNVPKYIPFNMVEYISVLALFFPLSYSFNSIVSQINHYTTGVCGPTYHGVGTCTVTRQL